MKRSSSLFFTCALFSMLVSTSALAESDSTGNGTSGDGGSPKDIIRRSPRQQPVMVSYNEGLLTVSAKQPYENVVMTIVNVETGEQCEITLGTVEGEVSVPILLPDGEYQISLICDQNLYSFTISVEED